MNENKNGDELMNVPEPPTFFVDTDGQILGSASRIISATLYKGMIVTIHPYKHEYKVVDWNYHHGHSDEHEGLRIFLEETDVPAKYLRYEL